MLWLILKERQEWFGSYLSDVIRREIRQITDIERLHSLPSLLTHIASSLGGILNTSGLSGRVGIPSTTLSRYMAILNAAFVISYARPWSVKLTNILAKSPRVYMLDTGLAGYLLNLNKKRLLADSQLFGRLLENFVFSELTKQISWSSLACQLYSFRTHTGIEVDFILQDDEDRLLPIEVKASKSVVKGDFRGIDYFAEHFRQQYHRGIVLYCGSRIIAFGNNRWAIPIEMLWGQSEPA